MDQVDGFKNENKKATIFPFMCLKFPKKNWGLKTPTILRSSYWLQNLETQVHDIHVCLYIIPKYQSCKFHVYERGRAIMVNYHPLASTNN